MRKKVCIGDLGTIVTGNTPPRNRPELYGNHTPFIKATDISESEKYTYNPEECYSEEGYNKYIKSLIPKGSTCVVTIGSIGKKMTMAHCDLFINQAMNAIIPNACFDSEYVYYAVKNVLGNIKTLDSGTASGRENVSKSAFSKMEIWVEEELPIQQRIATILSRYDSLIENYQKQIKLLEEFAQRLYKEWFIDLRFPGHENIKIVDGVPEGWEKKKIGDISMTTSGGTPSRTNNSFYSGSIMWVKTKELCDGFILGTEEKITEEAIKKSSAKIVPAGSILMAMYGATIGKLGIATKDLTCNQACCVFLISEDNPLRWYIFNWLLQNRNFLTSQGKGAAQPNLSQDMIKGFELIIPDDKSLRGYHLLINPIYLNIKSLQSQICQLTEARNRLLPKLMNGEIDV